MRNERRRGVRGVLSQDLKEALQANLDAAEKKADLKVGDPAPEFQAHDDRGQIWKSTDHVGKKILVVYFYPADMTGGCTKQGCSLRDASAELRQKGVAVIGVSNDPVEKQKEFKDVLGESQRAAAPGL